MNINRKELLEAVESISPALSSQKMLEELQHVWFTKTAISAYNDSSLGMVCQLPSKLSGGIRGNMLLGILRSSRAKEILVDPKDDGAAEIRAGKTKINLALLPVQRCPWEMPELEAEPDFTASQELLEGLASVLVSIGTGTTRPEQLGVSIIFEKDDLNLWTTDSNSIACATVNGEDWPIKKIDRVIWPTPFIKQLIKLKDPEMWVTENYVVAKSNGLQLFARAVDNEIPMDFNNMTENVDNSDIFDIPTKLRLALERASVMLKGFPNDKATLSLSEGILKIFVETPIGELRDNIKVGGDFKASKRTTHPDFITRVLDQCNQMAFTDTAIVMFGKSFAYWISTGVE